MAHFISSSVGALTLSLSLSPTLHFAMLFRVQLLLLNSPDILRRPSSSEECPPYILEKEWKNCFSSKKWPDAFIKHHPPFLYSVPQTQSILPHFIFPPSSNRCNSILLTSLSLAWRLKSSQDIDRSTLKSSKTKPFLRIAFVVGNIFNILRIHTHIVHT